jgi:hypothetical protein
VNVTTCGRTPLRGGRVDTHRFEKYPC